MYKNISYRFIFVIIIIVILISTFLNNRDTSIFYDTNTNNYEVNKINKFECCTNEIIPEEEFVFVTETGVKYHIDGCRYLRMSKIKIKGSVSPLY